MNVQCSKCYVRTDNKYRQCKQNDVSRHSSIHRFRWINFEAQKRDPLLGCYVLTAKDEGRQVSTAASQISSSDHPPPTSPFMTSDNPAIHTTEKHVIPAHWTSVHAHSPFGTQACPCRDFFQPFLLARLRDSCLFSKFELSCNIGRKWSVPQLLVNL